MFFGQLNVRKSNDDVLENNYPGGPGGPCIP